MYLNKIYILYIKDKQCIGEGNRLHFVVKRVNKRSDPGRFSNKGFKQVSVNNFLALFLRCFFGNFFL